MSIEIKAIDIDEIWAGLKWMVGVGLLLLIFALGYKFGANSRDEALAEMNTTLAARNLQISVLADQITGINAAAAKAIAEAKAAKQQAADAGQVAAKAEKAIQRQHSEFQRRLKQARKNPDCNVLLNTDVRAVCGL